MRDLKLIAHRGNLWGPNPTCENDPAYIDFAINQGFDVECDVRCYYDSIYLGHDGCDYKLDTPYTWFSERKSSLYIHCKDLESLAYFAQYGENFHYFWHQTDACTLTSKGIIWVHPDTVTTIGAKHILVADSLINRTVYTQGICTDHVMRLKGKIK